jgi:hypothetical protein
MHMENELPDLWVDFVLAVKRAVATMLSASFFGGGGGCMEQAVGKLYQLVGMSSILHFIVSCERW